MSVIMKLSTGKNTDGLNRNLRINVMSQEEGKQGFPAFINEVKDGKNLPGHRVTLFLNGSGDKQWFTVSGPVRKTNEAGEFVFQPRVNTEGAFLDEKGVIVDSADKAAQNFEYLKKKDASTLFGTLGSINIQNKKSDGQPTSQTLASFKSYTDQEAYAIARKLHEFQSATPEEKDAKLAELRQLEKDSGTYQTVFINEGGDALASLGFEVRLPEPAPAGN